MAKWGEGDPRWIVEERPDATNVNNWHWSEKDASSWSVSRLKTLLIGMKFEGAEGSAECTEVETVTGEATANNRKGKLIFFYEWDIKIKWKGSTVDGDSKVSGEISIPNLSEEHDLEEVDVIVTVKKNSKDAQKMKELVHRVSPSVVREKLKNYIKLLKDEFSQGLILPRQDSGRTSPAASLTPPVSRKQRSGSPVTSMAASKAASSKIGCQIPTTKVTLSDSFMTSTEELFNTLTTQELVDAFTHNKSRVEPRKGGVFSLMDGRISGEFVELDRPNKIVQRWREKSWPEGHYSTVTLELRQVVNGSKLSLTQTEVPEKEAERTAEGWKTYIFESIKRTFGFGASLM